jgi:hypothetical protein
VNILVGFFRLQVERDNRITVDSVNQFSFENGGVIVGFSKAYVRFKHNV